MCDEARAGQVLSDNAFSPQIKAKLRASAACLLYIGLALDASLCICAMPLFTPVLAPSCDRSSSLEWFIAVWRPVDKVFP